jgi:hypothetical protein
MLFIMISGTSLTFAQDYTKLSEEFFTAARNNDRRAADKAAEELAGIPPGELKDHLNTENKAKAFWINIYNTYVQYLLKSNPELFNDRNAFFKEELITMAGEKLSFDDIEHGIIRHSKN